MTALSSKKQKEKPDKHKKIKSQIAVPTKSNNIILKSSKLNGKSLSGKFGFLLSVSGRQVENLDFTTPKWVIVELTFTGEREKNLSILKNSVQKILNTKSDVFIPAVSQKVRNESHTVFYLDGYIFVKYEEGINYLKLQDTTYFKYVLHKIVKDERENEKARKRVMLTLLDDRELNPMRSGMEKLKTAKFMEDDDVKIIQGEYRGLQAKVVYLNENGETVQVKVDLKSKKLLFDFPSSYLIKINNQNVN